MSFTPEQWTEVKELFEAALERDAEERSAFLQDTGADEAVVREVERLLAHHSDNSDFHEKLVKPSLASILERKQRFSAGDLLASRFRVVRFLARGGMGEVYEAEDLELREKVALKTIRSELLSHSRVLERFKREVRLAKQVTHPNVCRIFDLVRHPVSPSETLVLVSMELLQGETLAEHLKRVGRMSTQDALPIATQMSSGLEAAHELGILHRDFKPANVVLVPVANGIRAVITDFGLALRPGSESSGGAVTTTEKFGTPAYMSPEQVEGKALTPASDVYALGLVLYQMVTGQRPFDDATPLSMAIRRLQETPTAPRRLVPELDPTWDAVILRCLERDPGKRFANGNEVAKALRGEMPVSSSRRRGGLAVVAAACFVTIFVLGLLFFARTRERVGGSSGIGRRGVTVRPSVAVLGFKNLSGRPGVNWVSTAVSEMLNSELGSGDRLRTVPGESVSRAKVELSIGDSVTLGKDTLARIRQNLGSDFVVLGSYLDVGESSGGQLRLDLTLQNARSGETLTSLSEDGTEEQLDDLVDRAGVELRHKLGLPEVTASEAASVKASLPSKVEAVRLYSEGLAKFRLFDDLAARDLLQKAITADPSYALAHSALADVWTDLGADAQAREAAKLAFDSPSRSALPHEQQLLIEARFWRSTHAWDKAIEAYHELLTNSPDQLDYGLGLVTVLVEAGKYKEAYDQLDALRKLPAPIGDDPRLDLYEAKVADFSNDFKRDEAATAKAVDKARARGAKLLLARGLEQQCRAYRDLGKFKEASAPCEEAESLFAIAGDRNAVAMTLLTWGMVFYYQGDYGNAMQRNDEALSVFRDVGNVRGVSAATNFKASLLSEQGDLEAASDAYHEALSTAREMGSRVNAAIVQLNMGDVLQEKGDMEGAANMYAEGGATLHDLGVKNGHPLIGAAEILWHRGELAKAKELLVSEAIPMIQPTGNKTFLGEAYRALGDVLTAQGDLPHAKENYEQAINLAKAMDAKATIAEYQISLAQLLIQEKKPAEAVTTAKQAQDELQRGSNINHQLRAASVLAQAELAAGSTSQAQATISGGRELLVKTQSEGAQIQFQIAQAKVMTASGQAVKAAEELRPVIAEAEKRDLVGLDFSGRLALGQALMRAGDGAAARKELLDLEETARAKGFLLIANEARETLAAKAAR